MITVFVISLKDAAARRANIERQFKELGYHFEWFDAVYGKLLQQEEIERLCDMEAIKRAPNWLTRGAIGCSLSHLEVYREIIKRGLPYAIVLEDDILLDKSFISTVDSAVRQLQGNEIILLYYQSWDALRLEKASVATVSEKFRLYRPVNVGQPLTTSAYIISRAACETMVKTILPVRYSADSWGAFYKSGGFENLRCIYPRLVDTADFKSSIEYVSEGSLGRVFRLIDKYRLFPFYQLLKARRRHLKSKMLKVSIS